MSAATQWGACLDDRRYLPGSLLDCYPALACRTFDIDRMNPVR
jgi:hypothetical protein